MHLSTFHYANQRNSLQAADSKVYIEAALEYLWVTN